jgi:hypothetical protein
MNLFDMFEDASGVIANKKQAKDPRYSMSLTKDVRPGEVERQLKKFNLAEEAGVDLKSTGNEFVKYCKGALGIKQLPKIRLVKEIGTSEHPTFGLFDPNTNTISVAYTGRHIMDVMRTLAHELTHHKQREDNRIKPDSGETGSEIENEANAQAGVLMRDFADQNAELFGTALTESIHSGAHKVGDVTFDITQHAIDRMEERNIPITTAQEMLRRIAASYSIFANLPKHEPVWIHDAGLGISLGIRPLSSGKLNWGTTILGEPQNRDARYQVIDI